MILITDFFRRIFGGLKFRRRIRLSAPAWRSISTVVGDVVQVTRPSRVRRLNTTMVDNSSAAAACSLLHRIFSDDYGDGELNSSSLASSPATANISLPPSAASPALDRLKAVITSAVIPAFCGFGVIGNVMTIVILSQRRMATAMSCRIKRASRAGLVGLAVADLLCCVAALAVTYGRDDDAAAYSERGQVRLLTAVYGPFVPHDSTVPGSVRFLTNFLPIRKSCLFSI